MVDYDGRGVPSLRTPDRDVHQRIVPQPVEVDRILAPASDRRSARHHHLEHRGLDAGPDHGDPVSPLQCAGKTPTFALCPPALGPLVPRASREIGEQGQALDRAVELNRCPMRLTYGDNASKAEGGPVPESQLGLPARSRFLQLGPRDDGEDRRPPIDRSRVPRATFSS
jgi:hypothetical protein